MEREKQSWTTVKVVLAIFLFLLSGIPNVSSQQNPYAPEVNYFCDNSVSISVEYEYWYAEVTCTISNSNPHDVTVKISEEWENSVDGPYEVSNYCMMDSEIDREIYVQGSSTVSFCYKISQTNILLKEFLFSHLQRKW